MKRRKNKKSKQGEQQNYQANRSDKNYKEVDKNNKEEKNKENKNQTKKKKDMDINQIKEELVLDALLNGMNNRALAKKAQEERYTLKQLIQEACEQEDLDTNKIKTTNKLEAPTTSKKEKDQTHKNNKTKQKKKNYKGRHKNQKQEKAVKGKGKAEVPKQDKNKQDEGSELHNDTCGRMHNKRKQDEDEQDESSGGTGDDPPTPRCPSTTGLSTRSDRSSPTLSPTSHPSTMQETARNLSNGQEQKPWEAPTSPRDKIALAQDIGSRHARIDDVNTEQEATNGARENQKIPNSAGRPPEVTKTGETSN